MADQPDETRSEQPIEPAPTELTEADLEEIDAGDGGQQTYPPYL